MLLPGCLGLCTKAVIVLKWVVYGLLFTLDLRNPETADRFVGDIVRLGTVPIKIMQCLVSTYTSIPDALQRALKDSVLMDIPPHPMYTTTRIMSQYDLDGQIQIEQEPIGSGSIAQVYLCSFRGTRAILKVRHPNVVNDIGQWSYILPSICFLIGTSSGYWMQAEDLAGFIQNQCDLRQEGTSLALFSTLLSHCPGISTPRVLYTQEDLVIMTRCEGSHLRQITINHSSSIDQLFASYLYTSCIHGVAHGDLHIGNFMVTPGGQVGLIDFGLVFTVSSYDRNPMLLYMYAKLGRRSSDISRFIRSITVDATISRDLVKEIQDVFCQSKKHEMSMTVLTSILQKYGILFHARHIMYLGQCIMLGRYYRTPRKFSNITYALRSAIAMCKSTCERQWIQNFYEKMVCLDIRCF
jgi:predicted unusual protein kinase regulating ubiquinone biosynthesis (AarF/ABC1/UbiB family)